MTGHYTPPRTKARRGQIAEDLTGRLFGKLTAIRPVENPKDTGKRWLCRCNCGTEKVVFALSLKNGDAHSCGCDHPTLQDRFDKYTIPEPNSGCLLWLGSCDRHGYGELRVGKRNMRASHVALQLAGKPIHDRLFACHSCDNPHCVNAGHLFHGTQRDNVHDMIRKSRDNFSGLAIGQTTKPDPEKLAKAKRLYELGFTQTQIGVQCQIATTTAAQWMQQFGYKPIAQHKRTHCPAGHPYSGDNLYLTPRGERICRACKRASNKLRKGAKDAAA